MVHLKLALVLAAAAANLCVAEDRSCKNHRLYCGHTLTSGMGNSMHVDDDRQEADACCVFQDGVLSGSNSP